jgi:hypothetical protein
MLDFPGVSRGLFADLLFPLRRPGGLHDWSEAVSICPMEPWRNLSTVASQNQRHLFDNL